MEASAVTELDDFTLAYRKAENAACRRYEAVEWLERLVGPLGISSQPSERELVSCLRNGLFLCKAINKIQPGAVVKVVDNQQPSQSLSWESQTLPAYQYFENVRNFLVAVKDLKLPAFEASDLETDTLDLCAAARVVDCILALKSYQEWKMLGAESGFSKYGKSPLVTQSACRIHWTVSPSDSCRQLNMSLMCQKQASPEVPTEEQEAEVVELIVKLVAECLLESKENFDGNLTSFCARTDIIKFSSGIMSKNLEEQLQRTPELLSMLKAYLNKTRSCRTASLPLPSEDVYTPGNSKSWEICKVNDACNHKHRFQLLDKEISDLKSIILRTKMEFKQFQSLMPKYMKDLEELVQELSTAALRYHKVVEENRKLYNVVQDLKGNIRVYCRIRPSFDPVSNNVIDFIGEDGSLVISNPSKEQKDGRKVFHFNHIFGPKATQDNVFRDIQPLIRSVMDGYNVCILAYGQTGSGKTYTMTGPSSVSAKELGINYLALNDLFTLSDKRQDTMRYEVHVQMVEIYNEQVRDLLAEDSSGTKLEIRICTENGLSLPDATTRPVRSTNDVLNLMKFGEVNRAVCFTAMNNQSSRSHSILTIHVQGKDTSGSSIRSRLHLVDLAGSERVDRSEVTGERLKEAQYINKSLSCLGDVITALAQKNTHIPYRNSKLTLLLQDSLGGQAKTLMVAHVSPEEESIGETISTLKFAQRVSTVELGAARSNRESSEVMQLKAQVESLKSALAKKEVMLYGNKEQTTPTGKLNSVPERTPPRSGRRLSIENCNSLKNNRVMSSEDKKGVKTPSVTTRSRRLSLETPQLATKDQPKLPDSISRIPQIESATKQAYSRAHDAESLSKLNRRLHNSGARSPTSGAYQKRMIKIDSRTQIHPLQLSLTPENAVPITKDFQTIEVTGTNGKASQMRKSLRTIGKLINGSEKRNRQNPRTVLSPIRGVIHAVDDAKFPLTATAKSQRRQSLTGIPLDKSRRSSIGGKLNDCNENDVKTPRTPPPMSKRWM